MNPMVPSQHFVNHFRTRQFDGREIVEFESSVDWSSEASTSAALDLISTFLREGDPLTGKLLWLNGDCFLFNLLQGYMQLQHELNVKVIEPSQHVPSLTNHSHWTTSHEQTFPRSVETALKPLISTPFFLN